MLAAASLSWDDTGNEQVFGGNVLLESCNMDNNSNIQVRPASLEDADFIISLVPRLVVFGPPSWRDQDEMIKTDSRILIDKLISQPAGTAIFIACDGENKPLGFIHVQPGSDYYNREKHGHISDIIVAAEAEGKGVGSVLMEKAEHWARSLGYRWLTLSVFAQNLAARERYERKGFGQDIIKYVKEL
jgi:GNAT superfamily N-acetyltransferase